MKRLPSGRITFTGFDRAGMYLPARDLATLYTALARDDHAGHQHILDRVVDVDVLEPFIINLFLAATRASHIRATAITGRGFSDRARFWHTRELAHRLLRQLTDD